MNKRIIEVDNCWDCPYNRQGRYCNNEDTMNLEVEEYATGEKNSIHPECELILRSVFMEELK